MFVLAMNIITVVKIRIVSSQRKTEMSIEIFNDKVHTAIVRLKYYAIVISFFVIIYLKHFVPFFIISH